MHVRKTGRTRRASGAPGAGSSLLGLLFGFGVLAVLASCATSDRSERTPPRPPYEEGRVVIESEPAPAAIIASALPEALARLDTRGFVLRRVTRVVVHTDEAGFFQATGQDDPGLRAWTTFDTIHLMPLQLWAQSDRAAVVERLAHELCHAAIYQRFGTEKRARAAELPRFFEEGTCSVVAGQDARRMPKEHVVALAPPMPFDVAVFRGDPEIAYAAAHHAMALLDETRGPGFLASIVDQAATDGGPGSIERALEKAIGTSVEGLWRMLVDSVEQPT